MEDIALEAEIRGDVAWSAEIGAHQPGTLIGNLHQPAIHAHVPGERVGIATEHGQVIEHLLILQIREGARLLDGSFAQPLGRAAQRQQEHQRSSRNATMTVEFGAGHPRTVLHVRRRVVLGNLTKRCR